MTWTRPRKILLGLALGLPLLGVLAWYVLVPMWVRGGGLNPDIEQALGDALGLQVRIGSVEGSVTSDVTLRDVVASATAGGAPILVIPEVHAEYDAAELRNGRVRALTLIGARVDVEHNRTSGWNWNLINRGGAGGPKGLPVAVDALTLKDFSFTARSESVAARLWNLSLDLGAIRPGEPVKARFLGPAKVGFAPALDFNLDPAAVEAKAFTLECGDVEATPFATPMGAIVKGFALSGPDLGGFNPILPWTGLGEIESESRPSRVRADVEWAGDRVRFDFTAELAGLRARQGQEPWHELGQKTVAAGWFGLDSREVHVERCRVDSERYGSWEFEGNGSLRTMEFLLRDLKSEGLDLASVSEIPLVAGFGWRFQGGALLTGVSGHVARDPATGHWQANFSGACTVPRLAAAFAKDWLKLQAEGLDLRANVGIDTRSCTCVIGAVGAVAKVDVVAGGVQVRSEQGIDGIIFQGTYRWDEQRFEMQQVDAQVKDLDLRTENAEASIRLPEAMAVNLKPESGGKGARFVFDRKSRVITMDGLRLTPRRGGQIEVSSRLDLNLDAFQSLVVHGRQVDLGFVQETIRRSLGKAAVDWSVKGLADLTVNLRARKDEPGKFDANYEVKGEDLALEAITDPGRPIGVALDADGSAVLSTQDKTLTLRNGRARLGKRGVAVIDGTIDLATVWPVAGRIQLDALDGPWLQDIARRLVKVEEGLFEGSGSISGVLTFESPRVGERVDAKVSFDGKLMGGRLFSRKYDVEVAGRQIDLRFDGLFPERKAERPVVSFSASMKQGTAKSEQRLYEADPLDVQVSGDLRFDRARDAVEGEAELKVTRAEFLWDTLYDPVRKDPVYLRVKGGWDGSQRKARVAELACAHPNFGWATGAGEFTLNEIEGNWVAIGRMALRDTSFAIRETSVIGLDAEVPFRVGYPELPASQVPEGVRESDWARVRVGAVERDRFRMEGLDLEFAVLGDQLVTRRPIELPVFGGVIRFERFAGTGLIPRSVNAPYVPEWTADVQVVGVKPGQLLWQAGNDRELPGTASGRFDRVRYRDRVLDLSSGTLELDVLGGKATVKNLRLRNPLSRWRLEGDVEGTGLDLLEVCKVFPELGSVEGKVDAKLTNLAVFEGTPVEFDLWFDNGAWSADTRQVLNHQAVKSIERMLHGGFLGTLEQNLSKRTWRYIHLGITARMKYAPELGKTFVRMRGNYAKQTLAFPPITSYRRMAREEFGEVLDQVVEGREEYFLVGGMTAGVNFINGSPGSLVDYDVLFDGARDAILKGGEDMKVRR